MPRKGENIYKRKDGRWEARYIKSHDISGRAKYGYVYGKSYREAKQKQHNALAKLEDSLDTGNNQVVLYKSDVKALSVYWLTSIEPQIKQSTFNKYNNLLASYIVPYLGDIEINDLAVDKLYEWCNYLLQKGGKKENGISPKTVSDALSLIRRIICHASSRGYKTLCTGKELSINQPSKEINVLTRSDRTLCADIYTSIHAKEILGFYYHYLPVYGLGSFVPWIGLIYRLKVEPYIFIKTFSAYKRKKIVKKRQKL